MKTPPVKVFTAARQWGKANTATIATLTSDIMKVLWGKTRKLRCLEIVLGLLHEATDYHPVSAMVWSTIANARRLMKKDSSIEQEAKRILKTRQRRKEEFLRQQEDCAEQPAGESTDQGSTAQPDKIEAPFGESTDPLRVKARSGVGAAVEPDPSRPFGGVGSGDPLRVGFGLSCERMPMACSSTKELSALSAGQRPPWVGVECTVCETTASPGRCAGHCLRDNGPLDRRQNK